MQVGIVTMHQTEQAVRDASQGEGLLEQFSPGTETLIFDKPTLLLPGGANPSNDAVEAQPHQWVPLASTSECFRARCPKCGVVREYDTNGHRTWVSYSDNGELLAHGELGLLREPECSSASSPAWM